MSERYSKADRLVACPICERSMILAARSSHVATEHPGYRLVRQGWTLRIIDPEGSERTMTPAEQRALRTRILAGATPPSAPASAVPPAGEEPGPTIDEHRQPFAWQAPVTPPAVSRQAIADALTERALASMFQQFSATLSEWDGAGEAGTLSAIESAQLASLFYDSTLSLIERYFRGSVDRFRLTLGLAILLLGKGRIHLAAIATRRRARIVEEEGNAYAEALGRDAAVDAVDEASAFEPGGDVSEPPTPAPLLGVALIAARQRAWQEAHGGE